MTENTPGHEPTRSPHDVPTAPHATRPPTATAPVDQPADQPADQPTPPRRTWRERAAGVRRRTFGLRGLVAAALAALIVGGLGGFAIGATTGEEHRDGRHERFGPGPGGWDGGGPRGDGDGRFAPPGGLPGQVPPTTEPDAEADPDSGSTGTPSSDLSS